MSRPHDPPVARPGWADRLHARRVGLSGQRLARRPAGIAPPAGDPAQGAALLAGRFALAHAHVDAAPGASIWSVESPVPAFEAARQGFGWLDDLAALGTASARRAGRAWVTEWANRQGRGRGPGWTLPLVADRLARLVTHAGWLASGEGAIRPARLERAFARHARFAVARCAALPEGPAGLHAGAELVRAAAALEGAEALLAAAQAALAPRAAAAVSREGAVADRAPATLAAVFCDLAFAAEALRATGGEPGPAHAQALAHAAPVLRALRHADGALARFHGGGAGDVARLDAAFAAAGAPRTAAPHLPMGYARLARGRATVIADAAAPPAGPAAGEAHASTLAFEMTDGRRPLIVNCGSGRAFGPDWHLAARGTASHSALILGETASARFAPMPGAEGRAVLAEGPGRVEVDLYPDQPTARLAAAHDGYAASHGLIHVRRLDLTLDGGLLRGEDLLSAVTQAEKRRFAQLRAGAGAQAGLPFALRFHLHPACAAELDPVREEVTIRQPSGAVWVFRHASGCAIRLDPSVYLENTRVEPAASLQIVLEGVAVHHATSVKWTLTRDSASPAFLRDAPRSDDAGDPDEESR